MSSPVSSPPPSLGTPNLIPTKPLAYSRSTEHISSENQCRARLTKVAQMIDPTFIFRTSKKILNPCGCSGSLCWVIVNILVFIITLVLYTILLPIKLILVSIRQCIPPPKVKILREPTINETNEVITPLIHALEQLLYVNNELRPFRINEENLDKAPAPNPFLNRLIATTREESLEAMRAIPDLCSQLKKVLKSLGVLTKEWQKMLAYFEGLKYEYDSHPDKQTFPIFMKILIEAFTCKAPFFSNTTRPPNTKEKQQAALFIAISSTTCKPTWGEVISRALSKLYSSTNEGSNQLLTWVQEFKEKELMLLQDGEVKEYAHIGQKKGPEYTSAIESALKNEATEKVQWHIINTMKCFYGKRFGLMVEHLQDTFRSLTLRQTTVETNEGKEESTHLATLFLSRYLDNPGKLVDSVFQALQKANPQTKNIVRDFALDVLAEIIGLPETTAHTEVFSTLLMDQDTYEPNKACVVYLLYVLGIIQP
ncbi:DUF1548 domain-containing protein [Candidatus Chlamydia corallus]|uniref:DUF1548 domain-containing protein n=1 Tax=Candidatus Chlamydia corallus TaxID=2038470 RepID=UPI001EFEAFC2|nr:DUF1548 domain-containing protein [Candidatus Chlamydia corallus]